MRARLLIGVGAMRGNPLSADGTDVGPHATGTPAREKEDHSHATDDEGKKKPAHDGHRGAHYRAVDGYTRAQQVRGAPSSTDEPRIIGVTSACRT